MSRTSKVTVWIGTFLLIALLFAGMRTAAEAASAEAFFKGKTIRLLVSQRPGGGTDLITRLVAPYVKKYTGAYAVIVDNVEEAGGLVAMNRAWSAKQDGLTLTVHILYSAAMMEATKQEGAQFKLNKFNIVCGLTSQPGNTVLVKAKGPFQSIDDLKKAKELKSAAGYGTALTGAFFADVFGLDAKVTPGFSTADARMALMREEIQFMPEDMGGAFDDIASGDMRGVCTTLPTPHPAFPNVPPLKTLANLSPQQKEWSKIFELSDQGKFVFAGPDVPKDRIQFLRNAMVKIHKDPQFLQDRKRFERWPGGEPFLAGPDAQKLLTDYMESLGKGYDAMFAYFLKKYYTIK